MSKVIVLDEVMISPAVFAAWQQIAACAAKGLPANVQAGDIPDERARLNNDGTLTIFVNVPGVINIWMGVSKGQWAYQQ